LVKKTTAKTPQEQIMCEFVSALFVKSKTLGSNLGPFNLFYFMLMYKLTYT